MHSAAPQAPAIDDAAFLRLQKLIEEVSGIWVTHPNLVVQRLSRRLRQLGVDSFRDYARRVAEDPEECESMIESICTHETRFFREPAQFEFLESVLCPAWRERAEAGCAPRSLRIWSAGCATGEEPFSVAMVVRAHLPGFTCEILGTDLSRAALERARAATWPISRSRDIPLTYLRRFMLEGTGSLAGQMRAAPDLLAHVRFQRLNLGVGAGGLTGLFDLIFCRNVLIYFREAVRERVLERILQLLRPGGHLFLGHAEGLGAHAHPLRAVGPIVYRSHESEDA